uniref:Mutator-like transposase n=1 Tax=Oryza sativa subsp. japonica TaxID=39947 RepID=Q84JZ9_ORYSJ|nr:putative mutator-like transposase [Oryza sativa Japonica Group]AAO72391.1 mutator-like transposase [Oryza sativa Japonica Group]
MTVRQLVFFAKPTFEELMSRIKHELDWNDESVGMQGRYDVGGGVMSHKFMLDLNGEIEWQTYIDIVLGSHFKSLEVFAWKKDGRIGKKELIDLNESPLIESPISCHELSERCSRKEELIEEDVEGGEGVNDMADVEVREENDPVREEVHAEENVPLREEVHAEDNVPLREEVNVEENVPVREEGDVEDGREVGDDVELPEEEANAKNVSMGLRELARLKFYTREECEEAMIRSGLNPGWLEYDTEDELDESASDSDDDRPVRKMSEHERTVFAKLVGRNPEITQFEDLTRSGLAIADGDPQYDGAFEPMCDEPRKGLEFRSMDDLKIWLQSYSIRVHRPYHVKESNASVKYTVACLDRHCKWQINARKSGGDRWRVTRVGEDHTCCSAEVTGKHLQLTSRFIGNRLQAFVRAEPTLSPAAIVEAVEQIWHYWPTYGKAWRAKQVAMKVIWGDWDEAYVRLPTLMRAIKAKNPTMHFRVEAHPEKSRMVDGVQRRVFGRAYWIFGQSIEAFKHLRPVLAIDGTFLTGKYQGTLLTAIGVDAGLHLVPLAFALVEKENTSNWEWFINMLRNKLIGPNREVCIISDRHPGILNSIIHIMPHHLTIHHRWCMRHFCANFYTAGATTDQMKDLERICQIDEKALFLDEIKRLMGVVGERPKKWLEDHMPLKVKWARAFDTNGRRHSIMTSNMAESFNNVLRGIRKLPVTAIVAYTFSKCNSWMEHFPGLEDFYEEKHRAPQIASGERLKTLRVRGHTAHILFDDRVGNWRERVEEYLGLEPPVAPDGQRQTKTSGVPLSWLRANFGQCPAEADEATVQRYCRAYVLYIFGSILFPDSGGDMASWMWLPLLADWDEAGTFSWGSAALAWLYRQLCDACRRQGGDANLAGCVWLLQVWMWMRLPVGRPMWRTHQAWPHQDADRCPTVAHLWESVPSPVVGRRNLAYYHYTNEMDYLQPEHVVWMPYQAQEVLELELNPMCHIEDALKTLRCPLICFYAVEFQMCHRVMRQFGRLQTIPHRFSTSIDLHKVDRRKNKKVTDWAYYHQDHITQWEKFEENGVPDQADIADDPEDVEEQNEYDTRTRLGTTVETGPVRDRVARELLRTVNDAGVVLGTAPGSEGEGGTLRNALQRLRQRCRKLAARLGCRSTDVVEHAHAHQEGDEEGEVGDEEGEQDKEAEEGDEEEEGDEDREEEADELGPSQLEDAPESSQPDISQPGPSRPRRRRAPSQDWRYTPDVPRPRTRAPVHLALRSQPSHPEGLLSWATAETAKSNLNARWAGAEFPTVSAIMDGAEVPARKPSRRLETAKAHLALSVPRSAPLWLALRSQPASHPAGLLVWALWAGAECPTVSAIMAGAEVQARKPSRSLAGLGLGGCGQVPPQRQSGWR